MRYLHHFHDHSKPCETIAAYIDFYNKEQFQKKLGRTPPIEFLQPRDKSNRKTPFGYFLFIFSLFCSLDREHLTFSESATM